MILCTVGLCLVQSLLIGTKLSDSGKKYDTNQRMKLEAAVKMEHIHECLSPLIKDAY